MLARECVEMAVQLVADRDMEKLLKEMDEGAEISASGEKLIDKYISSVNIAVDTISSRYYETKCSMITVSDSDQRITYDSLGKRVYDVLSVKNKLGQIVEFYALPFSVYVPKANTEYSVTFRYLPKKAESLDSELELLPIVTTQAVAFLMASDIALSRGLYDESKFFFSKFDSVMTQIVSGRRIRTLRGINLLN